MKRKINTLLKNVNTLQFSGPPNPLINGVQFDYQKVGPGDVYFALIYPGREGDRFSDGHDYIDHAIEKGASVIVCETLPAIIHEGTTFIQVDHTFEAMAVMVANFYGNPAEEMKIIGVTGTNGKTSVVTLLHQLFLKLGKKAGMISTVVDKINDVDIPTDGTTPNAIELNQLWRKMADSGCEYCFMEVTPHSIYQRRVAMVNFAGTVFTSLTADHIGYHGSFEEYARVKKSFFDDTPDSSFVVYNIDTPYGPDMVADSKAKVHSISRVNSEADFYFEVLENSLRGLVLKLDGQTFTSRLGAMFNAYNLMSAYAVAILLGEDEEKVYELLPKLDAIDGRFNIVPSPDGKIGLVDFAHNLGALEKLYDLLAPMKTNRLITVIGCGGDRVRQRAKIGKLTHDRSDLLVLTSDNPRSEEPEDIIQVMLSEIVPGSDKIVIRIDRTKAIEYAVEAANPGDIILLASKGHEHYQEIKGVKYPFNDKEILLEQFHKTLANSIPAN